MIVAEPAADALLAGSEAWLRLALKAARLGIWDWDLASGRIVYSDLAKEICGLAPDQEIDLDLARRLTHPDDLPLTAAQRHRAFDPSVRDRQPYEYRIVRPDGAVRWVRAHGEVVFAMVDGNEQPVRYTGTIQDISDERDRVAESRRAEQRLSESELRFREIANSTPVLIWMSDEQKDGIWFNQSWLDFTGRTLAEEFGEGWMAGIHPDDVAHVGRIYGSAFESCEPFRLDFRLRRRDGVYRRVENIAVPRRAGDGTFLGYIGSVIDVEEQRAGEERLRELNATLEQRVAARTAELLAAEAARRDADALYRAYFEHTAEALFVIGVEPDGGFLVEQVNPAHEALYGFKREEVRGRRLDELLPPAIAEQVLGHYRRCAQSGVVIHYRDMFELPDGQHHADTVLVPLRDAGGTVVRLVGSTRDITREVQAENALRQAQKMDAVGQLTGGIAHDFNNLLGAVMGGFDLIRRKADDPERVRSLADAGIATAERGARLTGQLLAFARAQRLELKPLVVSDLVARLADLLERTLGPMIRLDYDLHRERRTVRADSTQVEMAVLNLAINARDAMPDGGRLTIATRLRRIAQDPELVPGDYVELAVSDTGSGMPPGVAARALEPFFTTKGVGKGTGLGLSQVYGMARQSGGTVRLISDEEVGTRVAILLPCCQDAAEAGDTAATQAASVSAAGVRVLVVDDDPDMRRMLVEALAALGHEVTAAENGAVARETARKWAPDLAVLDFAMPGMNGAEVAQALREDRPDLPVLFASGYADSDAIRAVAGDGALLLRKPFRVEALRAAIAEALGGSRRA